MSPVEIAARVYETEPCKRTFREDLEAHLLHGYVFSTPEYFVMGRAAVSSANPADIVNPWHLFHVEHCDAWLVYLCAGDWLKAMERLPYPLPLIGWERRNILRFWPFDRFKESIAFYRGTG